jgi:hypothetical protein
VCASRKCGYALNIDTEYRVESKHSSLIQSVRMRDYTWNEKKSFIVPARGQKEEKKLVFVFVEGRTFIVLM